MNIILGSGKIPTKYTVKILPIFSYQLLDIYQALLGKRIKEFKDKLNISQEQLAQKANILFSTLVK